MKTKQKFFKYTLLTAALAMVGTGLVGCAPKEEGHQGHGEHQTAPQPQQSAWQIEDFTLTNSEAQQVSLEQDLQAPAKLVYFFFTNCGDVCPVTTARMEKMMETLKADGVTDEQVQFISISVDPARDTPEALKSYAEKFHADPETWAFLRGTEEETKAIIGQFGVDVQVLDAHQITHNDRLFLLNDKNEVVDSYLMNDATNEEIVDAIKQQIK